MHYIKDIVENNVTEHAHNKFLRYSKGNFVGPLMKIKFGKSDVKVYGSFHFVDELLILVAEYLGSKVVHVKGSLVWNSDLTPELAKLGIMYSKVTKSRGIFKYVLENDVNIKDFVEYMGKYNVLVSIKDDVSLVTKSSFPKPNKEFTNDFCKAVFPASFAKRILEEFAFETKELPKEVVIEHRILIDDIELPDVESFEEARRLAKRKGTLIRKVIVDGTETVTEFKFSV